VSRSAIAAIYSMIAKDRTTDGNSFPEYALADSARPRDAASEMIIHRNTGHAIPDMTL
jgi:hypothetical protein